jgi:hypothetical protein
MSVSKLSAALAYARTAPAHPVTIADTEGGLDITWGCPNGCLDGAQCLMVARLREHDWADDTLLPGDYLAVPTLWGVRLVPAAGEDASCA